MARKLAVISGKYGGFRAMVPMLRLFDTDPSWEVVVYLCDQHLWTRRGITGWEARKHVKEVCLLGTKITKRSEHRRLPTLHESFDRLLYNWGHQQPDLVIVYGDRLDALYGAMLAQELGIPVAHLQAGDRTGGTDDARRWAISALSQYLFCSSDRAYERCMDHWRPGQKAWVSGDHHIDAVLDAQTQWDNSVADSLPRPYYVVHMHPDTLATPEENRRVCTEMWECHGLPAHYAVLPPCNDRMWEVVDACVPTTDNVHRFDHIPLEQYVPLLRSSCGLVGNSSALFLDAPALGVPCFSYGNRQRGRDLGPFGNGTAGKQTYDILNGMIR